MELVLPFPFISPNYLLARATTVCFSATCRSKTDPSSARRRSSVGFSDHWGVGRVELRRKQSRPQKCLVPYRVRSGERRSTKDDRPSLRPCESVPFCDADCNREGFTTADVVAAFPVLAREAWSTSRFNLLCEYLGQAATRTVHLRLFRRGIFTIRLEVRRSPGEGSLTSAGQIGTWRREGSQLTFRSKESLRCSKRSQTHRRKCYGSRSAFRVGRAAQTYHCPRLI